MSSKKLGWGALLAAAVVLPGCKHDSTGESSKPNSDQLSNTTLKTHARTEPRSLPGCFGGGVMVDYG